MYKKLQQVIVTILFLSILPFSLFSQAPTLGTAANFTLFSSNGAVTNSGISQYTGDIGAKIGAVSGFKNVNGKLFSGGAVSDQAAIDLLNAYGQLHAAVPDSTLPAVIGNGDTLKAGTYLIPEAGSLNLNLYLDAKGDANAVFIFKVNGTFATGTNASIKLINGALACKVFWKVEGAVTLGTGTNMKGTIIANNGAITINPNDTLEGRALSTTGAVFVNGASASIPLGCGTPQLEGPVSPTLASVACYTIFSSNGALNNSGVSKIVGDVGTNTGATNGYNAADVTGQIHLFPDVSTATCASDLSAVYNYLNVLPHDIQLNFPADFGRNLILTPHTYFLGAATILTDTVYLDAQNNPNAVFVIRIVGAFSTSVGAKVILLNGAKAQNIFWHVVGAVSINQNVTFAGTIVSSGAVSLLLNSTINGRTLTIGGDVNTIGIKATMPPGCPPPCPDITREPIGKTVCAGDSIQLTVLAIGNNLSYRWRKGNINLNNTSNIKGVTNDTLVIVAASATDAGSYQVVVSGTCAINDTSLNALVTVNIPPRITVEPSSQIKCTGVSASFSTVATGTNLNYRWRKGNVLLSNTSNISGVNSPNLVFNVATIADTASNYNVIVGGTCLPSDTSVNVSLTINTPPIITTEPINAIICAGGVTGFNVVATGTNLSYRWRKGNQNLNNSGNISGATSANLIINPALSSDMANIYNVVVTGTCAPNDTSANVSLTVNSAPNITSEPVNRVICAGANTTFTVLATGTNLTYRWRKGTVNINNGGNISGALSPTLVINSATLADATSNYNLLIGGTCSPSDSSVNVSLTVNTAPVITTEPVNSVLCEGGAAQFAAIASGTNLSYRWKKGNLNLNNTGNISGAFSPTLSINPVTSGDAASNYQLIVSGTCVPNDTSVQVQLLVNLFPAQAGTITGPNNVCRDQTGFVFSVPIIANASSYLWSLPAGATITNGALSNSITVSFNGMAISGNISVIGINNCGNGLSSPNFGVTLSPAAAGNAGTITGASSVCQNQTGVVYSVASISNATTYTWLLPVGASITAGANTNSIMVSFSGIAISGNITVQGSNGCGTGNVSNNFPVLVNQTTAAAGIISGPTSACKGQGGFNFSVPAIANATSYIWLLPAGGTITNGALSNSITVSFNSNAISGNISVQGTNNCGNGVVSPNFAITLSPAAADNAGTISGTSAVCQNQSGVVYSIPSINNATTYTWLLPVGASITAGANTNSITVSFNGIAISGNITVQGSNGCGTGNVSANFPVVVNPIPAAAGTISGAASVCQNQAGVVYSVQAINNATSYYWTVPAGASIVAGSTSNSITVNFNANAISGNINVQGINACDSGAISTNFALVVNALPDPAGTIIGSNSACQSQGGFIFSVPAIANANSYMWTVPAGASISSGAQSNAITVSFDGIAVSGNISVLGINSCGNGIASNNFAVIVSNSAAGNAGAISGTTTVCQGQKGIIYSVATITNATNYLWTVPTGATIISNNGNTITVDYGANAANGNINVQGSNSCGNGAVSANFAITVNMLPNAAGIINGTAVVCQNQTGIAYSIPVIANATSYLWTVPSGASITAGATSNIITVTFGPNALTGNISAQGLNSCGNGITSNFAVLVNTIPAKPGAITGSNNACQGQNDLIYSIAPIAGASSYQWSVPTGASITSGQTSNSITVSYSSLAINGNVSVRGINACGMGATSDNLIITVSNAAAGNTDIISGLSPVCAGQSGVVYTVLPASNATSYLWSLPLGATITAGAISNSITVSFSTLAIGGNITVQASNSCGSGAVSPNFNLLVNPLPEMAGNITGAASVCQNQNGVIYSVLPIQNAVSYQWTVPTGSTITAGASSNMITVSFDGSAIGGNFSVKGINACGNGLESANFATAVNPNPSINAVNNQLLCSQESTTTVTFSGSLAGTTYNWTNSNTSIGLAASGTGSIPSFTTINTGSTDAIAIITITPTNSTCSGSASSFSYTVKPLPVANATSNAPICIGNTINLSAQLVNGATYKWSGPSGYNSVAQNPSINSASLLNAGVYTLTVELNACLASSDVLVQVTNCGAVDLSIEKTVNNANPIVGQIVIFTLVASNIGSSDASNVVVIDSVPSGYSFISTSNTQAYNATNGTWTVGALNQGETQSISISLKVNATGNYTNTAGINASEQEPNLQNNVAILTTYPSMFKIPAGYSPNGDGTNDVYVINGIELYPNNSLVIFNRWGAKVFESSPYNNTWNGTANQGLSVGSDELPEGTYFYVLNLGDGSPAFKGTIFQTR